MRHVFKIATGFITAITVGSAQLAFANLVADGGFELTSQVGSVPTAPSGQLGSNPGMALTDWTVASGSYNFVFASGTADTSGASSSTFNNTTYLWGPGANGGSVANGLTAASPAGGNFIAGFGGIVPGVAGLTQGPISQTINGLISGDSYTLSFYAAGAQQHGFTGATTDGWQVSLGSQTQNSPTLSVASEGFSGWQLDTMTFTATSTSEVLSFLALGTPQGDPPVSLLDGVDLELGVPDVASTAALLGLSCAALFLLPRLRRQTR